MVQLVQGWVDGSRGEEEQGVAPSGTSLHRCQAGFVLLGKRAHLDTNQMTSVTDTEDVPSARQS